MTECTHITTPVDPLRWLEACDAYRTSLTDPNKQAAFEAHRFELWPFLMARDGRLHPNWSPTAWTGRIHAKGPALQHIPKKVLRAGICCPGELILTADWRGSHLRLLAHYTGDDVLTADLQGDVYAVPAELLVGLGVPEKKAREAAKKALLTKLNGGGTTLIANDLVAFGAPNDIDVEAFITPIIRRWRVAFGTLRQVYFDTEKAGWRLTAPYGEVVEVPADKQNAHHVLAGWLQLLEAEALRHVVRFARRHEEDPKCIVRRRHRPRRDRVGGGPGERRRRDGVRGKADEQGPVPIGLQARGHLDQGEHRPELGPAGRLPHAADRDGEDPVEGGTVSLPIEVDSGVHPHHVQIPNGFGLSYPNADTGEFEVLGVAVNELTSSGDRDPFTGCPHHKFVRCQVLPAA